jgi:tubulin--tyrosine ligase-like protein 12
VSVYNKFWLRFANIPFSLDKFDVYEKHFTVMNYSNTHLEQVRHF